MMGRLCSHMFHYDCAMEWLGKGHDHCPCCRKDMMTKEELKKAAIEVLGEHRVRELKFSEESEPHSMDNIPPPHHENNTNDLEQGSSLT